jgi:hypothetical protein
VVVFHACWPKRRLGSSRVILDGLDYPTRDEVWHAVLGGDEERRPTADEAKAETDRGWRRW